MSRSFKIDRHTFKRVPDKVDVYKCTCSWCTNSKTRYKVIGDELLKANLKEIETWFNPRGRMRIQRINVENVRPLEQRLKACPKQVKVDLTKAKQKIKMKLSNAPLVQLAEA